MAVIVFAVLVIAGIVLLFNAPMQRDTGRRPGRIAGVVLALVGLGGVLSQSIVSVPAGYVGLKDFFGKISDATLAPGIHVVNPLLVIRNMDVRTQEITETANVPSKEGMNVSLDISVLYSLHSEQAADIYRHTHKTACNLLLLCCNQKAEYQSGHAPQRAIRYQMDDHQHRQCHLVRCRRYQIL